MLIDVSQILREYGGRINIDCDLVMDDADFLGETYHFEEPVKVSGSVINNGETLRLTVSVTAKIITHCARCAKPIPVTESFDIDTSLVKGDEQEQSWDDSGAIVFEGHTFDLGEIVLDEFFMNANGKYLCREDCKGLCPQCGADLNEGDCGCRTVDPRWEALLKIMDKSEDE